MIPLDAEKSGVITLEMIQEAMDGIKGRGQRPQSIILSAAQYEISCRKIITPEEQLLLAAKGYRRPLVLE